MVPAVQRLFRGAPVEFRTILMIATTATTKNDSAPTRRTTKMTRAPSMCRGYSRAVVRIGCRRKLIPATAAAATAAAASAATAAVPTTAAAVPTVVSAAVTVSTVAVAAIIAAAVSRASGRPEAAAP